MLSRVSFITPEIQKKYDLDIPDYEGVDQVVEIDANGLKL